MPPDDPTITLTFTPADYQRLVDAAAHHGYPDELAMIEASINNLVSGVENIQHSQAFVYDRMDIDSDSNQR
jgi:hypothetical protein